MTLLPYLATQHGWLYYGLEGLTVCAATGSGVNAAFAKCVPHLLSPPPEPHILYPSSLVNENLLLTLRKLGRTVLPKRLESSPMVQPSTRSAQPG